MAQYYVNFNDVGKIIGFYVDDIHGESIPQTAKPITTEEWKTYSADANHYKLDGDAIREKTQIEIDAEYVPATPPPKTADQLRMEQLATELADVQLALAELFTA